MRLAWNNKNLLLTMTKREADEVRAAFPIPVSRYRILSNRAGRIMLMPDGNGNELKEKPKSNGSDECVHQTSADSADNIALPRFWQIDIPDDCVSIREDNKGLVINVLKALEHEGNQGALEKAKPKRLMIAGRGAPKPSLKHTAPRRTSAKSDFIPTPDWIEATMQEAEDATQALTRLERLEQADIAILEQLLKRINGVRFRNRNSVRFMIGKGGFIGLVLASRVEIDCRPADARAEDGDGAGGERK